MRSNRSLLSAVVVLVLLSTPACNESSTGNTGDPLTPEEAALLFQVLFYYGFVGPLDEIDTGDDGPFEGTVEAEIPCAGDMGSVVIDLEYAGTYEAEFETGEADTGGTLDFVDCVYSGDVEFVLNGDPAVDVAFSVVDDGSSVGYQLDFDGGIEYVTSDDRTGRCAVNFSMEAIEDADDISITLSGSVCGVDAEEFEDLIVDN